MNMRMLIKPKTIKTLSTVSFFWELLLFTLISVQPGHTDDMGPDCEKFPLTGQCRKGVAFCPEKKIFGQSNLLVPVCYQKKCHQAQKVWPPPGKIRLELQGISAENIYAIDAGKDSAQKTCFRDLKIYARLKESTPGAGRANAPCYWETDKSGPSPWKLVCGRNKGALKIPAIHHKGIQKPPAQHNGGVIIPHMTRQPLPASATLKPENRPSEKTAFFIPTLTPIAGKPGDQYYISVNHRDRSVVGIHPSSRGFTTHAGDLKPNDKLVITPKTTFSNTPPGSDWQHNRPGRQNYTYALWPATTIESIDGYELLNKLKHPCQDGDAARKQTLRLKPNRVLKVALTPLNNEWLDRSVDNSLTWIRCENILSRIENILQKLPQPAYYSQVDIGIIDPTPMKPKWTLLQRYIENQPISKPPNSENMEIYVKNPSRAKPILDAIIGREKTITDNLLMVRPQSLSIPAFLKSETYPDLTATLDLLVESSKCLENRNHQLIQEQNQLENQLTQILRGPGK